MRTLQRRTRAVLFSILTPVGCAAGDADAPTYEVRDSAGIPIVVSHAPAWRDGDAWIVADSPAVRIGAVAGDPAQELFLVTGAVRLSDGGIAVANGGTHEVRVFDARGRHVRTIGGEGGGPGELRNPRRLFRLPDDSLEVVDFQTVSVFDPQGAFVRSTPIAAFGVTARLRSGVLVGTKFAPGQDPFVPGASRPEYAIASWSPWTGDSAMIAVVSGDAVYRIRRGNAIVNYGQAYGALLSIAAHGDELRVGDGVDFEVRVLATEGSVRRIFRRSVPAEPVTAEARRAFDEALLARARNETQQRLLRETLEELPNAPTRAHFDQLRVDADGNTWARAWSLDDGTPTTWSVFDPEGIFLGDVALPGRFDVYEIGSDFVLGRWRDDADVEYVVVHTLRK